MSDVGCRQTKNPRHPLFAIHFSIVSLVLLPVVSLVPTARAATGARAMVVTSDARATQAAVGVLEKGGNAADALVAAQAVLNVTEPHASGIGGAGYLLYYDAGTRRVLYFDGSTVAPGKAGAGMFSGPGGDLLSYAERRESGLAAGVPGALKLLREIQLKYGSVKFPFGKLLGPAIDLAEKGSSVSEELAAALAANSEALIRSSYVSGIFFPNGKALKAGDALLQPDLAKTLRSLAAQKKEEDVFYRGGIAKAVAGSSGQMPVGRLTVKDFSRYDLTRQPPLHGTYQGFDLFVPPPPSAGGLMVLASCNILSQFGLDSFAGTPEGVHWVAEVPKLAGQIPPMIGDPELFDLPVAYLLSQDWAEKQAARLDAGKVFHLPSARKKRAERERPVGSSSILIMDKSGSVAAYTGTLGSPFGSAMMVPGHGFFLNDLLNDFDANLAVSSDPDAVNVPEAYARPRNFSVMTVVFREGKPVLVLNARNAGQSPAVVVNLLAQWVDFNAGCPDMIAAPRVLDRDGVTQMEKALYERDTGRVKLELMGHKIEARDRLGDAQAICYEHDTGKLSGQSDPRGSGSAEGL